MPLIEQIRTATHDVHEALHHHELLRPLISEKVTMTDFQFAIGAFAAHYRNWETIFSTASDFELPNAPVLQWLSLDLELGSTAGDSEPNKSNDVPEFPVAQKSAAHYLGYLYTKQGSTLGGTVISKSLRERLSLEPEVDQHFFAGYGSNTVRYWKQFIERFVIIGKDFDSNSIVAGAVQAFESVTHYCNVFLSLKQQNEFKTENRTDRSATRRSIARMRE